MLSQIQTSHLIYKMVSGVKQHMLDKNNSILIDQMDIASDWWFAWLSMWNQCLMF